MTRSMKMFWIAIAGIMLFSRVSYAAPSDQESSRKELAHKLGLPDTATDRNYPRVITAAVRHPSILPYLDLEGSSVNFDLFNWKGIPRAVLAH